MHVAQTRRFKCARRPAGSLMTNFKAQAVRLVVGDDQAISSQTRNRQARRLEGARRYAMAVDATLWNSAQPLDALQAFDPPAVGIRYEASSCVSPRAKTAKDFQPGAQRIKLGEKAGSAIGPTRQ
jgi:hypothetical protein